MLCAKVGMLHPFLEMLHPLLPMHCPFLAMLRPLLLTHHPFLAMLHAFGATRCEGEDASHEESRGHYTLHGVPDPSRRRGCECVGSSSERETTRPACVGSRNAEQVS